MTNCVVDGGFDYRNPRGMLDTDALLAELDAKNIRNVEIAKALGLPDSRVPEIRKKKRALKLDEAVKLVRAFELERGVKPVPPPVLRLAVRYVVESLRAQADEDQIEELAQDLRAFSEFVSDPKVRESIEAAEGFFRAMSLRRPPAGQEAQRESDPRPAH